MGEKRNAYRLLVGKPEERGHYEDRGIDGWLILGWILWTWDGVLWIGFVWLRVGTGGEPL
jgi:hypothetical protein